VTATDLAPAALLGALHAALDADPSDAATRLALADLLADAGDGVAAQGQRWQALHGRWPRRSPPASQEPCLSWDWWRGPSGRWDDIIGKASLPAEVYTLLRHATGHGHCYKEYPTRRAAEDDLTQALEAVAAREARREGYDGGPCPWCGVRRLVSSGREHACDGCGRRWTDPAAVAAPPAAGV
jgi:hypothetical protein